MNLRTHLFFRLLLLLFIFLSVPAFAEEPADSIYEDEFLLDEVVVKGDRVKKMTYSVGNAELITTAELKRAACCNLGESFTTNPSVDVSYSDAATGARQIKLLGLSGTYVQMLSENVPAFRGIASPFGLGYVAGPWLQSIQVSKGASSVKNGYESITGQINIELKKPQNDRQLNVNGYVDHEGKAELNFDGNLHFGDKWSGGLLLHGENSFAGHDANDDGFIDMPKVRQFAFMNRWAYLGTNYVFQAAAKGIFESRRSGQIDKHFHYPHNSDPYKIDIDTKRVEFFTKNAYIYDHENDGNVALILSGSYHDMNSSYGLRIYDAVQWEGYASLMYERKWNSLHSLSAGLSLNYDDFKQKYRLNPVADDPLLRRPEHELVPGAYAQYTFNLDSRLIAMGGIRYDHSSLYGSFVTPRVHVRYNPVSFLSFHASAGSGRRSPHPLADFSYLFASSRRIELPERLKMESGWNYGAGVTSNFFLFNRSMSVSAEYYFTDFRHQLAADLNVDPHAAIISCDNRSRSNAFQVELTADVISDMTLTAAYRLTDVRVDYGNGIYILKPLTSKHKGLFTLNYAPFMGKWQFDLTLAVNGGGNMPTPYYIDGVKSWNETYPTYCQLNFQVTKNFRHWSIYVGGENLTNYRQKNPIIGAADPWGPDFDATMVWGPLHGAVIYAGFRFNLTKY